jgi:hypothetical protein
MKRVVTVTLLMAANFLIGSWSVRAQQSFHVLTPSEMSAFHECMHTAWVNDYCRNTTQWFLPNYSRWFLACVHANGGGKYPMDGRNWSNTEDYCRSRIRIKVIN